MFPENLRNTHHTEDEQIDWLNEAALDRLGFGSEGDIQRFWAAVSRKEVSQWASNTSRALVSAQIQAADKTWHDVWANAEIETQLATVPAPTTRLRILNPFDPAIRDRKRLARLFGFDYTVEMFVPAAKRQWGYYVYPLLEGDRFIGRCEIKADRKAGTLNVLKLWTEPGVRWSDARAAKLDAELARLTKLACVEETCWADGATTSA